jgi:antirestriction protein
MPRIYVADLAAYNAGYLHGEWIDLEGLTTEDVHERVQKILAEGTAKYARETLSVHEEWAIHDYEGFGPIRIEEYSSFETVVAHAERLAGEPDKYAAWMEDGRDPEDFDPDQVHGPYESESDYVDQWIDGVYGSMDISEAIVNAVSAVVGDYHKADIAKAIEGLSNLIEWRDTDAILRDWGNPLVGVPTGDYSREFYEVEQ